MTQTQQVELMDDQTQHNEDEPEPTEVGRKVQHPDDGYFKGIPCTCTVKCPTPCDGSCGCRACEEAQRRFKAIFGF